MNEMVNDALSGRPPVRNACRTAPGCSMLGAG